MTRLILDISTIARWSGPPVGIVRAEHELAQHALRQHPEIVLCFYDARKNCLREVVPRWRKALAGLDFIIDVNTLDFRPRRAAWRNYLSFRYPFLMMLQRLHLDGPPSLRKTAALLQKFVLGRRAAELLSGSAHGHMQTVLPVNMVLGRALRLGPEDTVLSAGSDWLHKGNAMPVLQRQFGFRLAVMCYDLLPLMRPDFFPPAELTRYEAYWQAVLPVAARILCNSRCIAGDIVSYGIKRGLIINQPVLVPLGYAVSGIKNPPPLRTPLKAGMFALFVSTLEPRKGHDLLLRAWRRLLAAKIPQQNEFHLVFVGRSGWMVEPVLAQLNGYNEAIGQSALHLQDVADLELERLYKDAAFCLYPSQYEGFGLPIIEAFAHGKAVIASTGGAIPETVAALSPCLDPLDEDAWVKTFGEWIQNPAAYAPWEQKIASEFRYETWPEAAEKILQAAKAANLLAK